MATLGSILLRKSGTAKTGRTVPLTLAIPPEIAKLQGFPREESASVLLLPVGEARKAIAISHAHAYIASQQDLGTAPALADELTLQFLVAAMHNPDDARQLFVDDSNIAVFREAIVGEQMAYLVREYKTMIRSEFPELVSPEDVAALKAEAKSVFPDGQP